MGLQGRNVLVVGLAVSGIPVVETLHRLGARIGVNDLKSREALGPVWDTLAPMVSEWLLGAHPEHTDHYDLMVLSPGVPTDLPFIRRAAERGTEVIGELELAYRLAKGTFIAITGTNGKTTTTALTGEIFKKAGRKTEVVGNIGLPAVARALDADADTVLVTEVSSFQLESCTSFRPRIAAVLNITPDHLNRHKTMENYIAAKAGVFTRQAGDDVLVLNYDNEPARALAALAPAKVRFFSRTELKPGFTGVREGMIVIREPEGDVPVCPAADLFMPGGHNLENALAAVTMAYCAGVAPEVIAEVLRTFQGVEHRIEWVADFKGVRFFNDSKGTNPDSTIKAVEAMKGPTVLIAGGMDKGSDFDEMIASFGGTVTDLVLLGETREQIQESARRAGLHNSVLVADMEEAVREAWRRAEAGGNILLSPACASWDMYPNFEVRGRHFKDSVRALLAELQS